MNHNHPTRDIKSYGKCPGCDNYHISEINKEIAEYMEINGENLEKIISLGKTLTKKDKTIPEKLYTDSVNDLIPVVEKLGLNMYISYLPSKKKYRARVWEYFKVPHNEKRSEYIYDKTPALALARALVKAIRERNGK